MKGTIAFAFTNDNQKSCVALQKQPNNQIKYRLVWGDVFHEFDMPFEKRKQRNEFFDKFDLQCARETLQSFKENLDSFEEE